MLVKHMQSIQSLISSKYQTVIPTKIRQRLNLKAGDKLIWKVIKTGNQPKIIAEPEPKNWAKHTRGLGKNIWQRTNIDKYIENLRSEWSK
jgi:AbrB family looped-hinge helix DNA binding protein